MDGVGEMSASADDQAVLVGEAEAVPRGPMTPGSSRRAFLAWRTTAAAMLIVWAGLASMAPLAHQGDSSEDFGWMILTALLFIPGVLIVVPAFVFTLGRWVDRRTSERGLRFAVAIFALCGLVFGIAAGAMVAASGDVTALGVGALVAAPAISAAAGRLLCELRGAVWNGVVWTLFVIALLPILALVGVPGLG